MRIDVVILPHVQRQAMSGHCELKPWGVAAEALGQRRAEPLYT